MNDLMLEQGHATLGAVDACVLLASQESDAEGLIRRVVERGRERPDVAEMRVRKSIPDTVRAWSIVAALDERLRGVLVEVNAMQVFGFEFEFVAFSVLRHLAEFCVAGAGCGWSAGLSGSQKILVRTLRYLLQPWHGALAIVQ